jgi:hypothetical protein
VIAGVSSKRASPVHIAVGGDERDYYGGLPDPDRDRIAGFYGRINYSFHRYVRVHVSVLVHFLHVTYYSREYHCRENNKHTDQNELL